VISVRAETYRESHEQFAAPVTLSPAERTAARKERARRALNVLVAGSGLIFTAPLLLAIAALIKITSKGPIFYVPTRVGLDRRGGRPAPDGFRRQEDIGGRPFRIYKFRTMDAARSSDTQIWARPDDPRITQLGRILRKYRLDELPQLLNVLRGDMNLVGPRPEQPRIFATLRERIDGYATRQRVLPGITGWAQVQHHYDTCVDDVKHKLTLDLEYIQRCSPVEDLKIMAKTLPVVVFRRGGW
jgi:lipopolysaccharide/colanic/teichoic acid biosynthesis glycosyltransferase